MRRLNCVYAAALLTAVALAPARAEEPVVPAAKPETAAIFAPASLARYVRGAEPERRQRSGGPAVDQRKHDSVLNGALIGAAIGGVGGSALIVASRGGSDDIARAMWNVALFPALAGAVAGTVIDAWR